ncbi:MAG: hypothetical protein SPG55_06535 [Prevotella sp.]|nr:hypothetical protein [Prevotella sp.]MDD7027962.1 hypothetical protein [Prevotellaceae bacterium]MDD7075554.1 hypothetical protein [Prevotellaceae bacterium]MDY5208750.1 hypothetical protein [Prevotella sp.]MDY5343841.1 hypothetical protein [Prevotella sp.]
MWKHSTAKPLGLSILVATVAGKLIVKGSYISTYTTGTVRKANARGGLKY